MLRFPRTRVEGGGVSFSPAEELSALLCCLHRMCSAPHPHGHLDSGTGAHRLITTSSS